jgi:hypothetical protein
VLDNRAIDNVLVLRLRCVDCRLLDQLLQDRVDDAGVPFGRAGVDVGCGGGERAVAGLV